MTKLIYELFYKVNMDQAIRDVDRGLVLLYSDISNFTFQAKNFTATGP